MTAYIPTIGLEIHAELKTRTKMFCDSPNNPFVAEPNTNVCPVCLAHPGTLPVINKEAVRHVLMVGKALGGTLADYTEFDRKNYFYPDLPKGYQISQYEYPLVCGGELNGIAITRVHLEEDTATSIHDDTRGLTLIDFNRAGVPLMELVTEPVIGGSKEAGDFARELQLLLRYLGVSEANMEKGEMRVEANISVAKKGERGTKVEIKNLNSFRAMERAVEYEIKRQTALLEKGEKVTQETRGWDEGKQATFAQRVKEGSADYRYFPDPDLPSLHIGQVSGFERIELPELPAERRERYLALGIKKEDAAVFTSDRRFGDFFDTLGAEIRENEVLVAANYLANDVVSIIRDIEERETKYQPEIPISAQNFLEIVRMAVAKHISSRIAKDLLLRATKDTRNSREIAVEEGLLSRDGEGVSQLVDTVIREYASVAEDYKAGKASALKYLIGQGMKMSKGAVNPEELRNAIQKRLS